MRALKKGCKGTDVMYLQYLLGIEADGSFGPATMNAVKEYQRKKGLSVDGSCGPATQKALGLYDYAVRVYKPQDFKIWFAGTPYGSKAYPLKPLRQWAEEENADYVYNLAFFNMSGKGSDRNGPIRGRTLQYVKGKGRDIGYGGTSEKITIDAENVCAGYKVAIKNGKLQSLPTIGKRARNANGILKDGSYFHAQSITKQSEYAFAKWVNEHYAVSVMLIQDAGGSTGFYDRKKKLLLAAEKEGTNGRAVATAVCIRKR